VAGLSVACDGWGPQTICVHCGRFGPTVHWVGEGGVLAFTHGLSVRWCPLCVATEQLLHARTQAGKIPELEAEVARLRRDRDDG
jgi:hypothetical protein